MNPITTYDDLTARLRAAGEWLWPLGLRLIMFWEFWDSGITKYRGSNWFTSIQEDFPFPFSAVGAQVNWFAATWGELLFSVMLLLGLFTRFAAFSLIVITVVATAAVHWPGDWGSLAELWKGYAISDKGFGNYKLPLLFVLMLLPLVFHGGGKASLDRLLLRATARSGRAMETRQDLEAFGWMLLVSGAALLFLMPFSGVVLLAGGMVLVVAARLHSRRAGSGLTSAVRNEVWLSDG
jgi:putative oxidoreductase